MNYVSISAVKADADNFLGRYREIISDPLNLAIKRHPLAGFMRVIMSFCPM
jgi:hypothetical protein